MHVNKANNWKNTLTICVSVNWWGGGNGYVRENSTGLPTMSLDAFIYMARLHLLFDFMKGQMYHFFLKKKTGEIFILMRLPRLFLV